LHEPAQKEGAAEAAILTWNDESDRYYLARVISKTYPDYKFGRPAFSTRSPGSSTLLPPEAPARQLSNPRCRAIINCVTDVKRNQGVVVGQRQRDSSGVTTTAQIC